MTTNNLTTLRWLTYMMFFMFAMTSDAVGVIIPELIGQYNLSMTQASAFHYAPMIWIAISGLCLGFLADKIGHKATILIGFTLFALACFTFAISNNFIIFVLLLSLIGIAIGLFKTAALALLGDLSPSNHVHTKTMNTVEGFFAIGAIVGPALVSYMITAGVSWVYLYVLAGVLCILLSLATLKVRFVAKPKAISDQPPSLKQTLLMCKDLHALGFSAAIALYVATEVAIYVWMPTLLKTYQGEWTLLATYALTIFFVLRAVGRFMATWLLNIFSWQVVMLVLSIAIFLCYLATYLFGVNAAVVSLPLSGLFMSMIYPTLNSKGISCFAKHQHGSVAGVILFFTALSAALAPLLMGVVSDYFGHIQYGFALATLFAALLMLAMLYNWWRNPAQLRLATV
ncbi:MULTISPECIES: MFS transporter [Pseudoalteromonas]|uniref:MFS transporter n=1 Tax=Pseudoalteromonas amylolytica TaxID=1859457 RepID=A0A1S1MUY3_9GAMM|nr:MULTISPECIES: MFS transporter [Pseudoalteromonas]OHU86283.1 MFS transporter [Pseudoalteromonas sp. JW3]OHU89612.1 MFS transporter [Pseudoalteromonas amylolytica]